MSLLLRGFAVQVDIGDARGHSAVHRFVPVNIRDQQPCVGIGLLSAFSVVAIQMLFPDTKSQL